MKRIKVALLAWVILSGMLPTNSLNAQETSDKIQWMTWEQATEAFDKQKKKMIVNVYTDWCGWCKRMDETTFEEPAIAKFMNNYFYPVKFDAEQKNPLIYNEKSFKYIKNGTKGYHELAVELLKGRLSFPSIVFIDEDMNVIQAIPGFKSAGEFEQIITYFAKDYYKSTPWSAFLKSYKPVLVSDKH